MTVEYTLLEQFDGTRSFESKDSETGEITKTVQQGIRDVQVKFTHSDTGIEHTRYVNVVLDSEGNYDEELTIERIEQVAMGVYNKILCGAITKPTQVEEPVEEPEQGA